MPPNVWQLVIPLSIDDVIHLHGSEKHLYTINSKLLLARLQTINPAQAGWITAAAPNVALPVTLAPSTQRTQLQQCSSTSDTSLPGKYPAMFFHFTFFFLSAKTQNSPVADTRNINKKCTNIHQLFCLFISFTKSIVPSLIIPFLLSRQSVSKSPAYPFWEAPTQLSHFNFRIMDFAQGWPL